MNEEFGPAAVGADDRVSDAHLGKVVLDLSLEGFNEIFCGFSWFCKKENISFTSFFCKDTGFVWSQLSINGLSYFHTA